MIKLTKDELRKLIKESVKVLNDDALFTGHSDVTGSKMNVCDICGYQHDLESNCKEKDDNYMSISHLMKIKEYSSEVLELIHDGRSLDDWMESHIAQISDDIGEVKHALEYKKHEQRAKH